MKEKFLLFSNDYNDLFGTDKQIIEMYKESVEWEDEDQEPNFDEVSLWIQEVVEISWDAFYKELPEIKVLCIADIGRWDGRYKGGKVGTLKSIVSDICEDSNEFYYNKTNGTIEAVCHHHDATNYFTFYGLSEWGEEFEERTFADTQSVHEHLLNDPKCLKRIEDWR